MTPDYDRAATKAAETLIRFNVCTAPVNPMRILKAMKGVVMVSFSEMSESMGIKRQELLDRFRESQDAATSVLVENGKKSYIVIYNQKLSEYMLQKALAREMGHIVLGHDGTLPYEIRHEEAKCFAMHLLTPRALIHSLQAACVRITTEVIGHLTGCNERCMGCMRSFPEVRVPAKLNRQIRDNFMDYILNFFEYQRILAVDDGTALADLGNYMKGYEE